MNEEMDDWMKSLLGDVKRAKPLSVMGRVAVLWWSIRLSTMERFHRVAMWWRSLGKPTTQRWLYVASNTVPANGKWWPIVIGKNLKHFTVESFRWHLLSGDRVSEAVISISINRVLHVEMPLLYFGVHMKLAVPVVITPDTLIEVRVEGGDPQAFHYIAADGVAVYEGPVEHFWSPVARALRRLRLRLELVRDYERGSR